MVQGSERAMMQRSFFLLGIVKKHAAACSVCEDSRCVKKAENSYVVGLNGLVVACLGFQIRTHGLDQVFGVAES
jgi:hypothetical protein